MSTLRLPVKRSTGKTTRICLRCEEPFVSHGPWNRRCRKCAEWVRTYFTENADDNFLYVMSGDESTQIQKRHALLKRLASQPAPGPCATESRPSGERVRGQSSPRNGTTGH